MVSAPDGNRTGWYLHRMASELQSFESQYIADASETQNIASLQKHTTMNEHLFRGQYRIDAARLSNYDYGSNGAYFVTICTRDKLHYFGEIKTTDTGTDIHPTIIGQHTIDCWYAIPNHFSFVQLDAFQLMPNHLHGILFFDKPNYSDWQPNAFGPQSQNLGSVLRGYKAGVKAFATTNCIDFAWQTRYHDRVIRTDDELNRIRKYIVENPANWGKDRDNEQGLYM